MSLADTKPVPFVAMGLTDSIDGTLTQAEGWGNMRSLKNLIPDPSTRGVWMCRPASRDLQGFVLPGAGIVSVAYPFGNLIYGLCPSQTSPGFDEPFCYDVLSDAMIPVAGVTPLNVPVSPPSSGDWSPPHMDLVGVKLVVTHPGFDGLPNFFGWFDLTDPLAPVWNAGNTTTSGTGVALAHPPSWVVQFYQRAYFVINPPTGQPYMAFTDPLTLNMSNVSNVLTFGDNLPITCAYGLPLFNQLGGIIQSLIVFKGVTNMYQVAGDAALANAPLSANSLNVATGTLAPNSVCATPKGLAFMAPDGIRFIDFNASISDPVGAYGQGVTVPFVYALTPSRAVAAYAAGVLRISVSNGSISGGPWQEYWYHMTLGSWSGPHTFPAACIVPLQGAFILAAIDQPGKLWRSAPTQSGLSIFVEAGQQMTWEWGTAMLSDPGNMSAYRWIENLLDMALAAGMPPITFSALDQNNNVKGVATYPIGTLAPIWGDPGLTWGMPGLFWGGPINALAPRQLKWLEPVVFNRIRVSTLGESRLSFRVGKMYARYETTGYPDINYEAA